MDIEQQIIVELDQVSKSYSLFENRLQQVSRVLFGRMPAKNQTRCVLNNVGFTVTKGEMVGILGINGAGKSTLLQLITGVLQPTSGSISVEGRIAALLELGAGFNPNWTGRDNTKFQLQVSGVHASDLKRYESVVEEFADIGVYFDQPVRTYSSGMFVRVAFAAAVAFAPDILIIDEALAVGDARFQNKCYNRINELKSSGTTIILVTHSMDAVVSFCDRGIVLEGGEITYDSDAQSASGYYMSLLYGNRQDQSVEPDDEVSKPAAQQISGGDSSAKSVEFGTVSEKELPALLASISKMAPSELSYFNKKAKNVGSGEATISNVALIVNGAFSKSSKVNTGDQVEIAFEVEAHQELESPAIGTVVKALDGTQVDLSASNLQKLSFPLQPAGSKKIYKVGFTARLAGGDYFIDLGISEVVRGSHTACDWRLGIVHVVIAPTPEFLGPADLSICVDSL